MNKNLFLEVPVFSAESAMMAQESGADRIELCAEQSVGGLTPAFETIIKVKNQLKIPFRVMIRPRAGDFLYTENEFNTMISEIQMCKKLVVDGIVFGILQKDGFVDKYRCKQLLDLANPMPATFHRAFDELADPFRALEDIIELGFDRILTSGQKSSAFEGKELIGRLIKMAGNRIIIMPGAGITAENIVEIYHTSGAIEFHASCKIQSKKRSSSAAIENNQSWETSGERIREIKKVMAGIY